MRPRSRPVGCRRSARANVRRVSRVSPGFECSPGSPPRVRQLVRAARRRGDVGTGRPDRGDRLPSPPQAARRGGERVGPRFDASVPVTFGRGEGSRRGIPIRNRFAGAHHVPLAPCGTDGRPLTNPANHAERTVALGRKDAKQIRKTPLFGLSCNDQSESKELPLSGVRATRHHGSVTSKVADPCGAIASDM